MITSNKTLKNSLTTLCVIGTFLVCSTAQAGWTTWNNGSGDGLWSNASNWTGSVPDASSDAAIINNLSTTGAALALTGSNDSFDYLRVGHAHTGHEGPGTLNIAGANLITTAASNTREGIGYGSGGIGILNLSSGSLTLGNQWISIGGGGGSQGTVNQTGGLLSVGGINPNSLSLGSSNSTALYNFTAGTLETREAFNITTGGSGTSVFQVNGYDASSSIQIGGTTDDYNGAWLQGAGTTLSLSIDGGTAQGTTLINIGAGAGGTHTGEATFAAGTILDLDFKSGATTGTWWTVLTAEGGITDGGFTFDDTNWDYRIVDGAGTSQSLEVTALVIPEPSSIALVLIVGAALLITRRRKA